VLTMACSSSASSLERCISWSAIMDRHPLEAICDPCACCARSRARSSPAAVAAMAWLHQSPSEASASCWAELAPKATTENGLRCQRPDPPSTRAAAAGSSSARPARTTTSGSKPSGSDSRSATEGTNCNSSDQAPKDRGQSRPRSASRPQTRIRATPWSSGCRAAGWRMDAPPRFVAVSATNVTDDRASREAGRSPQVRRRPACV